MLEFEIRSIHVEIILIKDYSVLTIFDVKFYIKIASTNISIPTNIWTILVSVRNLFRFGTKSTQNTAHGGYKFKI